MNMTETVPAGVIEIGSVPGQIFFSGGLAPYVKARTFRLYLEADAPPFLRMECVDTDLAFVLIDPYAVVADYRPEFNDSDVAHVGLKPADKPLILAIVNLSRGVKQATINLAGPLLINPKNGKAKQVVLVNSAQYSVRHSLT